MYAAVHPSLGGGCSSCPELVMITSLFWRPTETECGKPRPRAEIRSSGLSWSEIRRLWHAKHWRFCDYHRGGIPTPNRRFRFVLILSAMVGLRECGVHLACQVSRGYRGCRTCTCRTRRLSHPDPYLACVSRNFAAAESCTRLGLALRARPEFMATASPGTSPWPRKQEGYLPHVAGPTSRSPIPSSQSLPTRAHKKKGEDACGVTPA